MSVRYSVNNCMVQTGEDYDYYEEYIEQTFPSPRGFREKNGTVAIRVCKRPARNKTRADLPPSHGNASQEAPGSEARKNTLLCKIKHVPVKEDEDLDILSKGGIPQDILNQLDEELGRGSSRRPERSASAEIAGPNQTDLPELSNEMEADEAFTSGVVPDPMPGKKDRRFRDEDKMTGLRRDSSPIDPFKKFIQRSGQRMASDLHKPLGDLHEGHRPNVTERSRRETWDLSKDRSKIAVPNDVLSENDVLEDSVLEVEKLVERLDPHKYAYKHPLLPPTLASQGSPSNSSANQTQPRRPFHMEYDDYESEGNDSASGFGTLGQMDIRSQESKFRHYYIAAEEVLWDYGIKKPAHLLSLRWSISAASHRLSSASGEVNLETHVATNSGL